MGVVPGRGQHPGGREPFHHRCHHVVERREDHVPGGPGGRGTLTVRPGASGPPVSLARPVPGIQRPLVGRDVEHAGVVPEDVLCPVAVVHVPVDDEDPLAPRRQRGGGHRDVVEQAEAHGLVTPRRGARAAAPPRRRHHRRRGTGRRPPRARLRRPVGPCPTIPTTRWCRGRCAPPPPAQKDAQRVEVGNGVDEAQLRRWWRDGARGRRRRRAARRRRCPPARPRTRAGRSG